MERVRGRVGEGREGGGEGGGRGGREERGGGREGERGGREEGEGGEREGEGEGGGYLHSTFSSRDPLRKMDIPLTHSS